MTIRGEVWGPGWLMSVSEDEGRRTDRQRIPPPRQLLDTKAESRGWSSAAFTAGAVSALPDPEEEITCLAV